MDSIFFILVVVAIVFATIVKQKNYSESKKKDEEQTVYRRPQTSQTSQPFNLSKNASTKTSPIQKPPTHKHNEDGKSAYRIEKVPITYSAGGQITEGCGDHYFERQIKINTTAVKPKPVIIVKELSKEDLRKAFILGEVINKRKGR